MKKMVPTGDPQVTEALMAIFQNPEICRAGCGFICPQLYEPFELLESLEIWQDPNGGSSQELPSGVYRISNHQAGHTSHFIELDKFEKGAWVRGLRANAGWDGGHMIDWSGVRSANIQGSLPL